MRQTTEARTPRDRDRHASTAARQGFLRGNYRLKQTANEPV
jgi:hypothetical protein